MARKKVQRNETTPQGEASRQLEFPPPLLADEQASRANHDNQTSASDSGPPSKLKRISRWTVEAELLACAEGMTWRMSGWEGATMGEMWRTIFFRTRRTVGRRAGCRSTARF
jgi:hypothetical protein